jgi:CotS family spore coat protein
LYDKKEVIFNYQSLFTAYLNILIKGMYIWSNSFDEVRRRDDMPDVDKESIFVGGVEGINRYIKPEVINAFGLKINWIEPVRKVYRLITKDRKILAYKKINYQIPQLLFIYSAMEHLVNNGFTKLGRLITTKDNLPYYQIDNDIYVISEWVEGKEGDYNRRADLVETIKTMAELHVASHGFRPMEGSQERREWGHWINKYNHRREQLLEFKENILTKKYRTDFDTIYLQFFDYFYNNAQDAVAILKESPYFKLSEQYEESNPFCHHDLAYHNIIIDPKGSANLVDFDYCLCDLRIHDIGSLIIRNLKEYGWELDRACFILEQYHRLQSLTIDEIKVMQGFIHFPQDFWQVAYTYYCEDIGRTEKEARRRLLRAIKMRKDRERFLNRYHLIIR